MPNIIRIHVDIEEPLKGSVIQFLNVFSLDGKYIEADTADFIIVRTKEKMMSLYNTRQQFIIASNQPVTGLPENAVWFSVSQVVLIASHILSVAKKQSANIEKGALVNTSVVYPPINPSAESLRVLVIDDKEENLVLALEVLNDQHFVTLASGYGMGAVLMDAHTYDAVLSDCRMPIDTYHGALSVDIIEIGKPEPNGPYLMFKATRKGSRFAVVTDGNHHQDWVSAIFDDDDIRQPQTVNGQPVLLINYLGKRWDRALDKLMML